MKRIAQTIGWLVIVLAIGAGLSTLSACTQLTGVRPPTIPCHGDTVTLSADSAVAFTPHICGYPRGWP